MTEKEKFRKEGRKIADTLPAALTVWYPFQENSRVLVVGSYREAVSGILSERKLTVTAAEADALPEGTDLFDYIICIEAPETVSDPADLLLRLRGLLGKDGILLLGMNNRLGIRYFCGDRDLYTERNFDGIENYWRAYSKAEDAFAGRCYDKAKLTEYLAAAGFENPKFYSVFPDLRDPVTLYAEGYLPNEDVSCRLFPEYHYPDTLFLEEERLYRGLLANGLFHQMANAFLIECAPKEKESGALQITSSLERGRENAMITVLFSDRVEKRPAFPEGEKHLEELKENVEKLKSRGLKVIEGRLEQGTYVMPLIRAKTGHAYLAELLRSDVEQFLSEMDHFRELILQSSESFEGVYLPELTEEEAEKAKKKPNPFLEENREPTLLLKQAMMDLAPQNSFYLDGEFVFFDQEFCVKDYPLNVLLTRLITSIYGLDPELSKILPPEELYRRYGLFEQMKRWTTLEWRFLTGLRKMRELEEFHKPIKRNPDVLNANRQRMNYSADDYQRLFIDIFEYADTRKLILFGSGLFARRFAELYAEDYPVYAVVDNNEKRWGQEFPELPGIRIRSPELLDTLKHGEYKILICIKNYLSVMKQLDEKGIREYSIFDIGKAYQRKRHPIALPPESQNRKKYHTGYIAGVFDLYHIGHLNVFRRAKEQCDYLIVGVVSDEGVRKFKGTEPFVPFEERIEMVRSCRYVDEAVEIPLIFHTTKDAWRLHHFDVQFSGSDYAGDPGWLVQKDFLEQHGATLEFFPYTQSTSSTKLKQLIENKLI